MLSAAEQVARQFANAASNKQAWGNILFNVKVFGAKGDGLTDDTDAINATVQLVKENNGKGIYFPNGTYMIRATGSAEDGQGGGIIIDATMIIQLEPSAVLKAITGNKANSQVVSIEADNCEFFGGTIIGDRDTNTNTSEQGICLRAWGVSNVYIHDTYLRSAHGDCLFIGSSDATDSNFMVERVRIDSPRRWGIAVIPVNNMTIRDCTFTNVSTDLSFGGGIDIEDEYSLEVADNIKIENCQFEDTTSPNGNILIQGTIYTRLKIRGNVFKRSIASSTISDIQIQSGISDTVIAQNSFEKSASGILLGCASTVNVLITGNTFNDNVNGINLGTGSSNVITGVQIIDNSFYGTTDVAITKAQSGTIAKILIANNYFKACYFAFTDADDSSIIGNIIENAVSNGINLGAARIIVRNNTILSPTTDGITSTSAVAEISGNKVYDAGRFGIFINSSASNNNVQNNLVVDAGNTSINAPVPSGNKSYFIYNHVVGGGASNINAGHTSVLLS